MPPTGRGRSPRLSHLSAVPAPRSDRRTDRGDEQGERAPLHSTVTTTKGGRQGAAQRCKRFDSSAPFLAALALLPAVVVSPSPLPVVVHVCTHPTHNAHRASERANVLARREGGRRSVATLSSPLRSAAPPLPSVRARSPALIVLSAAARKVFVLYHAVLVRHRWWSRLSPLELISLLHWI